MLKIKHVYFLRPFFDNWRIFSFKNIELANEHRKNAHLQQPLFLRKKTVRRAADGKGTINFL